MNHRKPGQLIAPLPLLAGCLLACGCQLSPSWHHTWDQVTRPRVELPPPPAEAVYRAGHWEQEEAPQPGTLAGDFASAKVLFQRGSYEDAEKVFHWLAKRAERDKNVDLLEECLFMEAEAQYAQRHYPAARETYQRLLTVSPSSKYREEAIRRQFTIADYWLDDTRAEMQNDDTQSPARRWFATPRFFSFDREKPFFDPEGQAVKACAMIYTQDPVNPLAAQALYRAGGVSFYRERYDEADDYYSRLVEQFPRSPLAPHALELAIQSKVQVVNGPDYDGRKLAEARSLVDTALRSYPELKEKQDYLERTLLTINDQQAEKDFRTAEFYRRTAHPGAAYFYYELVRRRYAGTEWAKKAGERMMEIRDHVEQAEAK